MKKNLSLFIVGIWLLVCSVSAQKVAMKSNLLYDVTSTINLGVEYRLAPVWSLDLSGNYNGWTFSEGKKYKHWMVQPEMRRWFCETFNGHFVGAHLLGGEYNMGNIGVNLKFFGSNFSDLRENRHDGWYAGAGLTYGYFWLLSRHWNMEAVLGLGYIYSRYDVYGCAKCGQKKEEDKSNNYWGPTKVALNLIYTF